MEIVWEPEDIKSGRVLISVNGSKERSMIGYQQFTDRRLWTLNSLSDGKVESFDSAEDVVNAISGFWAPVELEHYHVREK